MDHDPEQTVRTGRCLCGAITFTFTGEPLRIGVCHCSHCQRQSGSAFSVNLVGHVSQLTVVGELATFDDRGEHGDDVYVWRRFCPTCGSPVVSEMTKAEGRIAVKAGLLDDTSTIHPTVEVWCVDRQPWVSLPGMTASLERQ